jgi:ribosomal protein S18 acetylase RimI-like enzyme
VIAELQAIGTIGLNVKAGNLPAIRMYESLGFSRHCEFLEALATARR